MPTNRSGVAPLSPIQEKWVSGNPELAECLLDISVAVATFSNTSSGAYQADRASHATLEASKADLAVYLARCAENRVKPDDAEVARLEAAVERDVRVHLQNAGIAKEAIAKSQGAKAVWVNCLGLINAYYIAKGVRSPELVNTELPLGDPLDIIPAQQATQKSLREERVHIAGSRIPMEEVAMAALAQVQAMAKPPFTVAVDRRGGVIIEPVVVAVHAESLRHGEMPNAPDAWAMLCWARPDLVEAEVRRQVAAAYEDDAGARIMPAAERRAALIKIDRKILDSERIEAEAVWEARRNGLEAFFRADIDPRAVLGVVA